MIVIDPLISQEVAAAALGLYHVYAGTAMLRRGYYYAAIAVPKSPTGTLGIGLGAGGSTGRLGLIAPTYDITHTGQEEVVDGVRLRFQMTPGTETLAEMVELPPGLDRAWHTHGYYGSASHNIKAIYQRYLGWYDGNPAHLWQHPPEAAAARYVETIGGVEATVAKARQYADSGDLRFAAELASHALFAAPDDRGTRELLASVFEQLGYSAENATWRNCFLTGAHELRTGTIEPTYTDPAGLAPALTTTQLFDSVAIRVDGPKAWNETLTISWHLTDEDQRYRMELSNGALVHHPTSAGRFRIGRYLPPLPLADISAMTRR